MAARKHDFDVLFANAKLKSGKSVQEIVKTAIMAKKDKANCNAGEFYAWLFQEFGLGRGYGQAIWINFDEISKSK